MKYKCQCGKEGWVEVKGDIEGYPNYNRFSCKECYMKLRQKPTQTNTKGRWPDS